jgi:hypothetical protein
MTRDQLGFFHVVAMALLLPAAACGPAAQRGGGVTQIAETGELGPALAQCMAYSVEGNGLGTNGLTGNGICQNGLGAAGLDLARLGDSDFVDWFNDDPARSDMIMRYAYKCAAAEEASLAWTNPVTGQSYTWLGGLGLATSWVSGTPATVAEQQVVTACLGALVNKYGAHVTLAVEGRTATGEAIPPDPDELSTFSVREACFFGNLFTNEGVFVGVDHPAWDSSVSSVRACAIDNQEVGLSIACPPEYYVGSCADSCTPDESGTFYESCTFNGVSYRPLVTRLSPSDVYTCGDGVCQISEHCGTGTEANDCSDCGPCP